MSADAKPAPRHITKAVAPSLDLLISFSILTLLLSLFCPPFWTTARLDNSNKKAFIYADCVSVSSWLLLHESLEYGPYASVPYRTQQQD